MNNDRYTTSARQAINDSKSVAARLGVGFVGTEHILMALAETSGTAQSVLNANGVTANKLIEMAKLFIKDKDSDVGVMDDESFTPKTRRVLDNAVKEANKMGADLAGTEHILLALLKENDSTAHGLLTSLNANVNKIFTDLRAAMGMDPRLNNKKPGMGGMYSGAGSSFMKNATGMGSSSMLAQYSRNLTEYAREGKLDPVIGREKEIERVIQILTRRTKNNPCLVGEPGVGKTAVAEGLAEKIVSGDVPDVIAGKTLLTLDLSAMVAGSKYRGEFEERIKRCISEVMQDGNILLFIDELHTIIGAGNAEGSLDASSILKPSLARGELQVIGATTLDEYRKHIEKDAALERRFQPVTVEEPSKEETFEILKGLRETYENHHRVIITDDALKAAVELSARYINDRFLPDKAIDVMDEAASKVRLQTYVPSPEMQEIKDKINEVNNQKEAAIASEAFERASELKTEAAALQEKLDELVEKKQKKQQEIQLLVTENEIADVVAMWTKIPVKKLKEDEKARLLKLEETLHERVVSQAEAVTAVAKAIRRGRTGLKDPKRPIGSFLFLGPTGVGKTELSKALAQAMFGNENAMIRVDMSEYMEKESVSKMIGSAPGYVGYEEGGQLSEKVRRNPYSVVLFDEIEKAHPDVFNVLLQVLDDGHITDSQGRKVDFKNTIIIMTSNAGASNIVSPKHLGFGAGNDEKANYEKMKTDVMDEVKRMFKPEFLNRIDDIIVFKQLNKDDIRQIVEILTLQLSKRCKEQMDLNLDITEAMKDYLADKGYDEKYGARPLKRAIQTELEDNLAEALLAEKIKASDTVKCDVKDGKVIIEAEKKKAARAVKGKSEEGAAPKAAKKAIKAKAGNTATKTAKSRKITKKNN